MKKRWIIFGIVFVLAVITASVIGWKMNRKVQITAYVYDPCGGCFTEENPCKPCTVEIRLYNYLKTAIEAAGVTHRTEYQVYNLLYEKHRTELNRIQRENRKNEPEEFPLVFIDGQPLSGWDELQESFIPIIRKKAYGPFSGLFTGPEAPQMISLEPDGENRIVYFKSPDCVQCGLVENFIQILQERLPENSFAIDTYDVLQPENIDIMEAYCLEYELDPDMLMTPVVFIGKTVLEGSDEIETFLELKILQGDGFLTPAPVVSR